MYKESKRERRIRDRVRRMAYVRQIAKRWRHPNTDTSEMKEFLDNCARKLHDNLKECQHVFCCNPRHHLHGNDRITMAERRADIDMNEQLSDLE